MRRSWVWLGMGFQLLPGSRAVIPMDSWQVLSTLGWMNWSIVLVVGLDAAQRAFGGLLHGDELVLIAAMGRAETM